MLITRQKGETFASARHFRQRENYMIFVFMQVYYILLKISIYINTNIMLQNNNNLSNILNLKN